MSLIQVQGPGPSDRQPSPGLTSNLPSNNPFRNRAASPANSLPSPITNSFNFNIPSTAPERPTSRNPFLDQNQMEKKDQTRVQVRQASPDKGSSTIAGRRSPDKPALTGHSAELFDNLTLEDRATSKEKPPPYADHPARAENVPFKLRNGLSGHHHPSRSQDEPKRTRNGGRPRDPNDIFADPPTPERRRGPRPRRNSDSSIASKALNPEDEQKRRERRRKEREARHKDGKGGRSSSKPKKPHRALDVIDSLDVTSIYGTGLFHHDGPFDACNPHRNRKGSQRAPMQAFAKDSANNVIGGSGPVNKNIDFAQFHGRGAEGFTDYSASAANGAAPLGDPITFEPYAGASAPTRTGARPGVDRTSSFNATDRVAQIHGETTMGLGTSTFLEGAPAARTAIQRRESDSENTSQMPIGLGRKTSLAQKIRSIKGSTNHGNRHPGRVRSPENMDRPTSPASPSREIQSAGGMPKIAESTPFFNEYDDAYDQKTRNIEQQQANRNRSDSFGVGAGEEQISTTTASRSRALSSPKRERGMPPPSLERRITNDAPAGSGAGGAGSGGDSAGGGGFLNRVKSLKGGKRTRPERVL